SGRRDRQLPRGRRGRRQPQLLHLRPPPRRRAAVGAGDDLDEGRGRRADARDRPRHRRRDPSGAGRAAQRAPGAGARAPRRAAHAGPCAHQGGPGWDGPPVAPGRPRRPAPRDRHPRADRRAAGRGEGRDRAAPRARAARGRRRVHCGRRGRAARHELRAVRRDPDRVRTPPRDSRFPSAGSNRLRHRPRLGRADRGRVRRSRVRARGPAGQGNRAVRRAAALPWGRCGVVSGARPGHGVYCMISMSKSPLIASDYLQPVVRLMRRTVRFWWVALAAFVVGMGATFAAMELRAKQYRSEAVVYYQEGLQWTANEGMSTRRIGQRLKDMLLARAQLAKLIDELGLYPQLVKAGRTADAVEEMRLATSFKLNEGDVFVLSYTGNSPDEAKRVTAKLPDVLIGENTRLRAEQAEVARAFLDAEKKRNEDDLAAKEAEQLRFLAKHPEFAHEQSTIGVTLRATKKDPDAAGKDDNNALGALRREEERLRRQIANPQQIPRPPRDPPP